MALEILQLPVLSDNYIYLAHDAATGETAAVDPALAEPVLAAIQARGWHLTHILNTHHHPDHVGGNLAIKEATGCRILGPRNEAAKIPGLDQALGEGDRAMLGGAEARVFDVPGHTAGHIAYWFAESQALFCGDTLFALGCGRLFEGSPEQMWASLSKLAALPGTARVYCAHEYTEANARYAVTVEPQNAELLRRQAAIKAARAQNKPTVPSTMEEERATNPFLRAGNAERFAEIRRGKDQFRG